MKLSKAIEQLHQVAQDLAKEKLQSLSEIEGKLDYGHLLARTDEEYAEWLDDVEDFGKVIETSEALGVQNTFVELKKAVETSDGLLRYIQLSQPVPNKIYPKYGVVAVVYAADNWGQLVDVLAEKKIQYNQPQKQGDTEVIEIKAEEHALQFRSNPLSKEIQNRNKPLTDSERVTKLQSEIAELKSKIAELEVERAAKLQVMADFQNFRKRVEKEKASFGLMANMALINEVIDVADDVKRTIDDQDKDLNRSQQMFKIINDKLLAITQNVGIQQVPIAIGDNFNSETMEAVGTVPVVAVDDHNKVMGIIQLGYRYSDRDQMMRVAKVIVGKKETKR